MSKIQLCLQFRGRINRAQFWGAFIPIGVFEIIISSLVYLVDVRFILLLPPVLYVEYAVCVKRLHDINISGWVELLFIGTRAVTVNIPIIGIGASIIQVYLCGFRKGNEGENKYGTPPESLDRKTETHHEYE